MAIRIRCDQCSKKISIDEAFAGGYCRCPYCSAIMLVPGETPVAKLGKRPDRPDRPETPTAIAQVVAALPPPKASAPPKPPAPARPAAPAGPARRPARPAQPARQAAKPAAPPAHKPAPAPPAPIRQTPAPAQAQPPVKSPAPEPKAKAASESLPVPSAQEPNAKAAPELLPVPSAQEPSPLPAPEPNATAAQAPTPEHSAQAASEPQPAPSARQTSPAPPPPANPAPPPQAAYIPVADRVRFQGMVAMVMSALLLLIVGGGIIAVIKLRNPHPATPAAGRGPGLPPQQPPQEKLFLHDHPMVAGVPLDGPVVFVIDASDSMRDDFDAAIAVLRHAVLSLTGSRFNVLAVHEGGVRSLADGFIPAGGNGDEKLREFLPGRLPSGATNLHEAVQKAIGMAPKTVVILAAKAVKDAADLPEQAQKANVKVSAVLIGADADAAKAMKDLAGKTGGSARSFSHSRLAELLEEAPPLP